MNEVAEKSLRKSFGYLIGFLWFIILGAIARAVFLLATGVKILGEDITHFVVGLGAVAGLVATLRTRDRLLASLQAGENARPGSKDPTPRATDPKE